MAFPRDGQFHFPDCALVDPESFDIYYSTSPSPQYARLSAHPSVIADSNQYLSMAPWRIAQPQSTFRSQVDLELGCTTTALSFTSRTLDTHNEGRRAASRLWIFNWS
jgi:hypothetical protein